MALYDDELGFIDTAVGAAKGIGKGIKKLFGGRRRRKRRRKRRKAARKKGQTPILDTMAKMAGKSGVSLQANPLNIARAVVAAVPGPVRDVVLESLRAQQQGEAQKTVTMDRLAGQIDAAMKPQIEAMLLALKHTQLSKQATYEHRELKARDKFRTGTKRSLADIMCRLEQMEARLNKSAVVPNRKVPIFGNRNVLE